MLKILFCGLKYDYGKPHLGSSFEYRNFYEVLKRMEGMDCELFAIDEKMLEVGRDALNAQLIYEVEQKKPDLLFCFLFTEELKKETISHITKTTSTKTFNWFADDHWRLDVFSKHWASVFTAVSTTDSLAPARYKALGINNIIKTQWAANHFLYKPQDESKNSAAYEITFVGKNHGKRAQHIQWLKKQGMPAEGFGGGWPSGRVSDQHMLEIFSSSKINLNFADFAFLSWKERVKMLVKFFVRKELGKYKINIQNFTDQFRLVLNSQRKMIKGRVFEVPACGGFLLTQDADNVRDYYEDGKEVVIFKTRKEMLEKCKYYLAHEEERKAIARAGYARTIKDHTYEKRFREIFKAMGLG